MELTVYDAFIKSSSKYGFIYEFFSRKKSSRLSRLFAVACCYQVWEYIPNSLKPAVEISELYADGLVNKNEKALANHSVVNHTLSIKLEDINSLNYNLSSCTCYCSSVTSSPPSVAASTSYSINNASWLQDNKIQFDPIKNQALILKNMFGNWNNSWNTKDVNDLATTIYNNKSYSLMPILSDALIEAGCQDQNILEYCQTLNFYFRGCWVLDKGTGKR